MFRKITWLPLLQPENLMMVYIGLMWPVMRKRLTAMMPLRQMKNPMRMRIGSPIRISIKSILTPHVLKYVRGGQFSRCVSTCKKGPEWTSVFRRLTEYVNSDEVIEDTWVDAHASPDCWRKLSKNT